MISRLTQQQAAGASSVKIASSCINSFKCTRRRAAAPVQQQQQIAWGTPRHTLARHPNVSAKASKSDTEISGYTPADYITYSEDPEHACYHVIETVVDAPPDVCFEWWNDWQRLVDFLDLVGQIGLDDKSPDMALFQCYYRWAKLPVMEITFLMQKTKVEPGRRIDFNSVWGMPLKGNVQLSEADSSDGSSGGGSTRVRLEFTHPMPNLLLQLNIGSFGVETHMQQILSENMEDYKSAVEAAAAARGVRPPGVLRQKTEELQRRQQQQQQEASAGQEAAKAPTAAEAAPAAASKQRRTRASSRSKTGAVTDAAAAPKSSGRRTTSRRTGAVSGTGAEGSGGAGRRGRPSTSSKQ